MFEIIPELDKTVGICIAVAMFWMSLVQYSRYSEHRKKHSGEQDAFAYLPYYFIPAVGCAISVFASLVAVAYCLECRYIVNDYYAVAWSAIATVVVYMVLDYVLIRKIGDVVYYETIERKVAEKTAEVINLSDLSSDDRKKLKAEVLSEILGKL